MRNLKKLFMIGLMTILATWFPNTNNLKAQPGGRVSFQVFYDQLAPYGDWVRDREYGYIWIPDVHPDFHPYSTDGYWVRTKYGNTWVSNYDWGWAPFHYGRWTYDNYYGWAWIPGYEWGPAWVNWRSGGGYYGWAPMGPSIHIHIPVNHWIFIPQKHIFHHHPHHHHVGYRNMNRVYRNTTIINNTYIYNNQTYYSGPNIRDMERATRTSVRVRDIESTNRPGKYNVNTRSVQVYRPEVTESSRSSARPNKVVESSNIRGNRDNGNMRSSRNSESSRMTQTPPTQQTRPRQEVRSTQQRVQTQPKGETRASSRPDNQIQNRSTNSRTTPSASRSQSRTNSVEQIDRNRSTQSSNDKRSENSQVRSERPAQSSRNSHRNSSRN